MKLIRWFFWKFIWGPLLKAERAEMKYAATQVRKSEERSESSTLD